MIVILSRVKEAARTCEADGPYNAVWNPLDMDSPSQV